MMDTMYVSGEIHGDDTLHNPILGVYKSFVIADHKDSIQERASYGVVLANFFRDKGNYLKSLEFALRVEKDWEELKDTLQLFNIKNILSYAYYQTGDISKAKEYTTTSRSLALLLNDKNLLDSNDLAIGVNKVKFEKGDSARYYLFNSLRYFQTINDEVNISTALTYLGKSYEGQGLWDSAQYCYLKAKEIFLITEDACGIICSNLGLVRYYLFKNDLKNSLKYALQAYDISIGMQDAYHMGAASGYLSEVYSKKGNFKSAYKFSRLEQRYQRNVQAASQRNLASLLHIEQLFEEIDLENAIEKKDAAIEEEIVKRQEIAIVLFFVVIIVLIGIVLLLARARKKMSTMNKSLQEKHNEIKDKNEELNNLNGLKNRVFSTISHDLRAPIGSVKGILTFIKKGYVEIHELPDLLNKAEVQVESTLETMDNLLQWAKNQMEGIEFNPIIFDLTDLIKESINVVLAESARKKINVESEVSRGSIMVLADQDMVRSILRNLLNNAIKFTHSGGEITVAVKDDSDKVFISIKDTGIGMSDEKQKKLFFETVGVSTAGTENEKGTGLGLSLTYEFVRRNGGEIFVESKLGEGSTFTFYLPKIKEEKSKFPVLIGSF